MGTVWPVAVRLQEYLLLTAAFKSTYQVAGPRSLRQRQMLRRCAEGVVRWGTCEGAGDWTTAFVVVACANVALALQC